MVKSWVGVMGAWLSAFLPVFGEEKTPLSDNPPNIVFILADDLGLGDVKCYAGKFGRIETPHLDSLAAAGMMFTDAHSADSVCTPSRYALLTGRYCWRSCLQEGVWGGLSPHLIDPRRETVASFLRKAGYRTACFGKWHLGMDLPTTDGKPPRGGQVETVEELRTKCNVDWHGTITNGPNAVGFDYFLGMVASPDMPPYIWIENDRFQGECTSIQTHIRTGPAHADFRAEDVLPRLAREAPAWIRARAREKRPFFLYLAIPAPHTPIVPSAEFQGKSGIGRYGDYVMETDWVVGEVVRALKETGVLRNTLIIFSADNGCSPAVMGADPKHVIRFNYGKKGEKPKPGFHYPSLYYRGYKADLYEGGHRVPFIARWDGRIPAGRTNAAPICLVDFFATCADLLDRPIPSNAAEDSVSFLPQLLGETEAPAPAVVHHSIRGNFAVRRGRWKLLLCEGSGGWSPPTPKECLERKDLPSVQLFDLLADPGETTNVQAQHPETVRALTELLKRFIKQGRSTPGPKAANDKPVSFRPANK